MQAKLNEPHEVSTHRFLLTSSSFVGKNEDNIGHKVYPNYTPQGDTSRNPSPILKDSMQTKILTLKFKIGALCIALTVHFMTNIKIGHASNYMDFWT